MEIQYKSRDNDTDEPRAGSGQLSEVLLAYMRRHDLADLIENLADRGVVSAEDFRTIEGPGAYDIKFLPPKGLFDVEEATRFLSALDPNAVSFTFQTLRDHGSVANNVTRMYSGPLHLFDVAFAELQQQGAGIHVTICETDLTGRKRENIRAPRAVFCDFDGVEAPISYDGIRPSYDKLPPSIVVQTRNGQHMYWLLYRQDPIDLERWSFAQHSLANVLGADPSCKDPSRTMRLPGSRDVKKEAFRICMLVCHPERRYKLSEIESAYELPTLRPDSNQFPS